MAPRPSKKGKAPASDDGSASDEEVRIRENFSDLDLSLDFANHDLMCAPQDAAQGLDFPGHALGSDYLKDLQELEKADSHAQTSLSKPSMTPPPEFPETSSSQHSREKRPKDPANIADDTARGSSKETADSLSESSPSPQTRQSETRARRLHLESLSQARQKRFQGDTSVRGEIQSLCASADIPRKGKGPSEIEQIKTEEQAAENESRLSPAKSSRERSSGNSGVTDKLRHYLRIKRERRATDEKPPSKDATSTSYEEFDTQDLIDFRDSPVSESLGGPAEASAAIKTEVSNKQALKSPEQLPALSSATQNEPGNKENTETELDTSGTDDEASHGIEDPSKRVQRMMVDRVMSSFMDWLDVKLKVEKEEKVEEQDEEEAQPLPPQDRIETPKAREDDGDSGFTVVAVSASDQSKPGEQVASDHKHSLARSIKGDVSSETLLIEARKKQQKDTLKMNEAAEKEHGFVDVLRDSSPDRHDLSLLATKRKKKKATTPKTDETTEYAPAPMRPAMLGAPRSHLSSRFSRSSSSSNSLVSASPPSPLGQASGPLPPPPPPAAASSAAFGSSAPPPTNSISVARSSKRPGAYRLRVERSSSVEVPRPVEPMSRGLGRKVFSAAASMAPATVAAADGAGAVSEEIQPSRGGGKRLMKGGGRAEAKSTKRDRPNDRRKDEEEDDEDGNRPPRAKLPKVQEDEISGTKLACPFFKHNPRKYKNQRPCCGPGWDHVHRIKEHIYRKHSLPKFSCPRCSQPFETQADLQAHARSPDPCEVREPEVLDGITQDQEKKLRSRKKTTAKELTEAEKWTQVYSILFPDVREREIPSPYYNAEDAKMNLGGYEDYLRRELPPLVRRELEREVERELSFVEEGMKQKVIDIARNLQLTLFKGYQQLDNQERGLDGSISSPGAGEVSSSETGGSSFAATTDTSPSTMTTNGTTPEMPDPLEIFTDPEAIPDFDFGFLSDVPYPASQGLSKEPDLSYGYTQVYEQTDPPTIQPGMELLGGQQLDLPYYGMEGYDESHGVAKENVLGYAP